MSNDVYRILCSSDLFLLPSQKESFGLAALEAMAARTPVIATNEGGIPEVVENNISGFLTAISGARCQNFDRHVHNKATMEYNARSYKFLLCFHLQKGRIPKPFV